MSRTAENYGVLKAKTLAYLDAHPTATSVEAAAALGTHSAYVRSTAKRNGRKLFHARGRISKNPAAEPVVRTFVPRVRIKAFRGTPEQYDALARLVRLEDLDWQDCRFPIGDPKQPDFGFCGHAKAPGKTRYCQHHFLRSRNSEKAPRL